MSTIDDNPFDLERFVMAQKGVYAHAVEELRRGQKQSHWMWFIFPQMAGLGGSPMAVRYAIGSVKEARAFLKHPVLGPRLLECCRALLAVDGKTATEVMGYPDDVKLRSSMTLFELAADGEREFCSVLEKYFGGARDERTLLLVKR